MRIAVNLVRDYARNRRLQFWKRLSGNSEKVGADSRLAGTGKTPESQLLMREQVSSVWRAAGNLPERQRTVFLLRFVEDMELLEIASATGMKEGTVKAHLFSAVRKVRKEMGLTI
jgi:RNA polymerase sigma-70 factor (ECF subfamily)